MDMFQLNTLTVNRQREAQTAHTVFVPHGAGCANIELSRLGGTGCASLNISNKLKLYAPTLAHSQNRKTLPAIVKQRHRRK